MEHISQTTLLLDTYLLKNLSLRVATASATSQTPNIFKHSAAISEVFSITCFWLLLFSPFPFLAYLSSHSHGVRTMGGHI